MIDPLDLAYAAGLIDGEGTIGITELKPGGKAASGRQIRISPSHRIYVAITMTDQVAIAWMQLTFGGHFQNLKARQPQHKPTFRWSLGSEAAAEFCEVISPYLKVKRQQAEIAARFYREHMGKKFQGASGLPVDELALRRKVMAEVKQLNQRGVKIGGKKWPI